MLSSLLLHEQPSDRQYTVLPAIIHVRSDAQPRATNSRTAQNIIDTLLFEAHMPNDDTRNPRSKNLERSLFRLSSFANALNSSTTCSGPLPLPAVQIAEGGFYFNECKRCFACCSCGLRINAIVMLSSLQRLFTESDQMASADSITRRLLTEINAKHSQECRCKSHIRNFSKK